MLPKYVSAVLVTLFMTSVSACSLASAKPEPGHYLSVGLCTLQNPLADALYQQRYFTADGNMQTLLVTSDSQLTDECIKTRLNTTGDILWAAPASEEQLESAGTQFGLLGDYTRDPLAISEVIVIAESETAPASASEVERSDESAPPPADSLRQLQRGAWFWSPHIWQQTPGVIWQAQIQQQLTEVYISVPVTEHGRVQEPAALASFIAQASARELDIWVVIGDPHDVLDTSLPALDNRMRAFLQYNEQAPSQSRFTGVQLDIEPYLLPGFARAQGYWRDKYAAVINHVHQMLDGDLPLDLVMPAWWGIHQQWKEQLFSQLPSQHTRFNVMNYHTSKARLRSNAEHFLRWGAAHDIPVIMALESGYLATETHRRYQEHENTGELWLLPLGDEHIFVLFDKPQAHLAGHAYEFLFDYQVPASDYTFAGDLQQLNLVAAKLAGTWQSAPAFAGIAIHGLDDPRTNKDLNDQE